VAIFSYKLRSGIAAAIFPAILLVGCATSDDANIRNSVPKLAEFDVPRPLLAIYVSEIDMLKACKVGPVSTIFDLSIDPSFDRDKQTASIALIGTGYFTPHTWGMIDMQARGDITHVRVYGGHRPVFDNLGRDIEIWANAGNRC
jgi:hypothetical protein